MAKKQKKRQKKTYNLKELQEKCRTLFLPRFGAFFFTSAKTFLIHKKRTASNAFYRT